MHAATARALLTGRKPKVKRLIFAAAIALSGCAAMSDQWTTVVVDDTNRGDKPVRYEESIRTYLNSTMKDPFSMQIRNVTAPVEGYTSAFVVTKRPTLVNVHGMQEERRRHGWMVTAEVNGKNSYGAYVGWHSFQFVFRGEEMIHAQDVTQKQADADLVVKRYLSQ